MNNSHSKSTKSIVATAFFAAIIYLGIQSFRIPLPAAVGTPFLHFGHIFVMLAIICLGSKKSAVAGVTGLIIFDIVNGFIHAIPNVFVCTLLKCFVVGAVFNSLKNRAKDEKQEYIYAIICSALYGVVTIVFDFIWSSAELVILGSTLKAALLAEITSIPATIINAVFTVIGITILYKPVVTAYKRILR